MQVGTEPPAPALPQTSAGQGGDALLSHAPGPLFWQPRFAADPGILPQVPLLFWLVDALRPLRVAVLGTGQGGAFFALCQALDRLNLPARCLGYGIWGDETDRGTVPAALADHAARFYGDLAELIACPSPEALAGRGASSGAELLFVDLTALPPDLPAVADLLAGTQAVAILHGTRTAEAGRELRALLERARRERRLCDFAAGAGLGLLAPAAGMPPQIDALARTCRNGVIAGETDRMLRRLGEGLAAMVRLPVETQRAEAAEQGLSALETAYRLRGERLDELQAGVAAQETGIASLTADVEEMAGRIAALEAQKNGVLAAAEAAEAARAAEIADLTRDHGRATARLAQTETRLAEAETRLAAERDARFFETAALTRRLEERTAALAAGQAAAQARETAAQAAQQAQQAQEAAAREQAERFAGIEDGLRREIAALADHNRLLLDSTSWRITAPLRKIVRLLRR